MGSSPQLTQSSNHSLIAARLRRLLEDAVERAPTDGILLSGGLDTSILSAISGKLARRLRAVSVAVAGVVKNPLYDAATDTNILMTQHKWMHRSRV